MQLSAISYQPRAIVEKAENHVGWALPTIPFSGLVLNVAASFSLRLHRRDARATKDLPIEEGSIIHMDFIFNHALRAVSALRKVISTEVFRNAGRQILVRL
jgi:hypothetical protein